METKNTCLLYGEGGKDKNFIYALTELEKFKYFTAEKWRFRYGNAHGESPFKVLEHCITEKNIEYNLVMCFIDLDKLKKDYKKNWEKKMKELEIKAMENEIKIVWFLDSLEQELKNVLGSGYKSKNKHKINKAGKENIEKFINSSLWNRILEPVVKFNKKD